MKKHFGILWSALYVFYCVFPSIAQAQNVPNKEQIVRKARQAYYNLRSEGLAEFQCSVVPNWSALLAGLSKSDPEAANRAIKTLNELHFSARLGRDGKVQIMHNDPAPQNQQMAEAFHQIYGGMEQMTTGFFDTWSVFMLNHPFPEVEGEYQLQTQGPQYLLSYKEGGTTNVTTTMDREFAIHDLNVKTNDFDSKIQPRFTKTPKGFLFTAYDASYESGSASESTHLKVQIGYQEVDGLQLIQKLSLSGAYGSSPFAVEVTFSDCTVTKAPAARAAVKSGTR